MVKKYLTIAHVSFSEDFAYRLNFILWRLRLVLQVLISYFLWQAVFASHEVIFGYDQRGMLTYVFATIFVRPLVFASRAIDVASLISSGDLVNILLKPVNFFKYYFVRDVENKLLNFFFAALEFTLLVFLFRPSLSLPTSFWAVLLFALALVLAVFLFFLLNLTLGFLAFWIPENAWAPRFFFFILFDFFSGSLFPLDIFAGWFGSFLKLTPFYYLLFFPLSILLGRQELAKIYLGFFVALLWLLFLNKLCLKLWRSGLKTYGAWGR